MGHLFVAELRSRSARGAMGLCNATSEAGDADDVIVDVERVDATYDHCGGLSAYGRYLVIGCESGCSVVQRASVKRVPQSISMMSCILESPRACHSPSRGPVLLLGLRPLCRRRAAGTCFSSGELTLRF
mmetsp:Transcript_69532/g.226065  ORF Transcript_69532/g.226065 Transcript_69532/m.226065 type:complete len:129 (+) Transcript_69532:375-761(+)